MEAALTGEATIQPHTPCDFLETFMMVVSCSSLQMQSIQRCQMCLP